ncbi:BapC protein, partial [Paraburkholderia sp. SIMBA_009]
MKRSFVTFLAGITILASAGTARADCFDEAAKYQKVNPLILRAIAWQ